MGVPGLWQELAAAGIDRTLSDLAWEKWKTCPSKKQGLQLGIDATLWMYHARKAKGGKNPALRSLFFRLARLLTLPITPIFVLDGAERPKVKRDAAVYTGVHAIQVQFCAMLDAFQFAHWTAPAEAEAELAWMDKEGLIDAVLTDDVDALLFGARMVVRNSAWHERDHDEDDVDKAAVYDTAQGDWSVDSDGMVLVALLAGADYDTQGMFRCGVKTAIGLARAGFGAKLLAAFRTSYTRTADARKSAAEWDKFVAEWCTSVRAELVSNASGMLPRRLPKLASEMPDLFSTPDARQVLHSYVWPITSSTADRARVETVLAAVPRAQLPAIAKFAMTHFQWARDAIAQRMERILYPGLLVRELQEAAYAPATPQASPQTTPRKNKQRSPVTQITDFFASASAHSPERARNRSRIVQVHAERAAAYGTDLRVSYDTQPYLGQIQRALELEESDGSVVRAWLPECLLLVQGPQEQALVRAYRQQQQRKALGSPSKKQKKKGQARALIEHQFRFVFLSGCLQKGCLGPLCLL
ncbi:uncharacterized protein MJAP1_003860 [Malassezia japonica]|uniref:XPG-I domain-containing protein n=1 Tax=Malassezia japonica TaxID=223818 RepID=A0AAF0F5D7_9BASI|nr:uncharacterized protein MJAP1_003860 [Malassezia japonica]WFD40869.1 hypothetical protein MJAP1_003860 [Malassezia japonica]